MNQEKSTLPENLVPFFNKVKERKGKISTVHYERECQPKKNMVKKHGEIGKIEKKSVFQVRAGIDYENQAVVAEKHESGEVERKGLPASMEKIETGCYKNIYKDSYYVGCAPVHNENSIHSATFLVDGEELGLDDVVVDDIPLRDFLYATDLKSHDSDWLMLNVEHIKSLSGV